MTDKIYLDEAINDLHTILDMVRWSVSRFNDAELYFGHGTDNPWDEAVSLVLYVDAALSRRKGRADACVRSVVPGGARD